MNQSERQLKPVLKRISKFLGSIQLAVPVLFFVAAAMAWGTYLESTQSSAVSRATVYGSWWFIGLMLLICVSLIFAVVNRYPWKRKHVGFITVHAGLIILIVGSFWSMFGRIEGHLTLEEGASGDQIETEREVVELAEFNAGKSTIVGSTAAPNGPASLTLGAMKAEVVERWDNCQEINYVADDAPEAMRAIEVSGNPTATEGDWVGEEAKAGGAPTLEGMTIRVLPDGAPWTPPIAPVKSVTGYVFVADGKQYPVGEIGSQSLPGWTIVSIQKFEKALVTGGKITEGGAERNPAIEVVITNGQGSSERHTSFEAFPDMVLAKTIEGTAKSEARLTTAAGSADKETFVLYGTIASPKFGYISPDGAGRELATPASAPWVFQLGTHQIRVLRQLAHARAAVKFVKAPTATDRRPAIVLKIANQSEPVVLAWKQFERVGPGGNQMLRFGPQMVQLPFSVKLNDFRKTDYPGTEMAMSYESDVTISSQGMADLPYLIHMNTPYAFSPWKVYQSGFVGERVTVLSVMRDPGLPMTYAGSIVLCVGIFVTFFVRPMSSGHPGIPAPSMMSERRAKHDAETLEAAQPVVRNAAGRDAPRTVGASG